MQVAVHNIRNVASANGCMYTDMLCTDIPAAIRDRLKSVRHCTLLLDVICSTATIQNPIPSALGDHTEA